MSMTDDDKAQNWCSEKLPCARYEALSAENERMRVALTQIARLRTDLRGDFSLGSHQSDIARAALGETE